MLDRDVSGRDLKIISEALYIAIPFMLKHTMSASNTRDMIRIMEYIDKEFIKNLNIHRFLIICF